jgi:hypothetical protein
MGPPHRASTGNPNGKLDAPAREVAAARPPERGYSWPPFQPGHKLSMRHGAFSARVVDALAEQITAWALSLAAEPGSPIAHLGGEHFLPSILAWARDEARVLRLEDDVAEHGMFDGEGQERAVARMLERWSLRAESKRQRLGLDPLSLARLRRDLVEASTARALLTDQAQQRLRERQAEDLDVQDDDDSAEAAPPAAAAG